MRSYYKILGKFVRGKFVEHIIGNFHKQIALMILSTEYLKRSKPSDILELVETR